MTGARAAPSAVPPEKPGVVSATPAPAAGGSQAFGVQLPSDIPAPPQKWRPITPGTRLTSLDPNRAAKEYFGAMLRPSNVRARSIGSYAKGCLAGGKSLPTDGPGWQVMRLSRNRNWGHPVMIDYLEDLARDAPGLGWRGLLVGDMAQPRGGPMTSGHSSHQIGLDADIWLKPMPDHRMDADERENVSAVSMLKGPMDVKGADRSVDPRKFTDTHAILIRRAAQDPRTARIFVSPAIKKALCAFETGDRSWLRVIRPWWGHHYHFHVRLSCPKGSSGCKDQTPPPPGDGCGKHLAYWLSDEPWVPKDPDAPVVKRRPMELAALPNSCRAVLEAQ
ncbi:penicillin-insensitive murein endopeptidase [Roseibium sp. CAU 1637]|uniref:Penicillin-insensitive murein endopeptidase n=1 Tax=Roseibium limicola TaxID=2816037 RepID=A0A939EQF5_9HYPH|nr:penicillin-insensitive murein endopeptidase [Roseibium limicola]MBO0345633.1 penicillin-insensitive murein endopeptidase [Roseibium limicola]